MYYTVSAQLIPATAAELHRKLTDGTIKGQEPDGREIVASMKRAVIDDEGVVYGGAKSAIAPHRSSTSEKRFTTTILPTSRRKKWRGTSSSTAGR